MRPGTCAETALSFFFFNCLNFSTLEICLNCPLSKLIKKKNLKSSGMRLIPDLGTTQVIGNTPTDFNGNVIRP